MKIKITTKNRLGLSKDVLTLLVKSDIDVKKVEVEVGLMYLETDDLDKHVERNLASQMMQIEGVEWVENVSLMPAYERNLFLTSLLNAIGDPVFGINNKGMIIYQNDKAKESFDLSKDTNLAIKDIFINPDWAAKIDAAASGSLPVSIKTISGNMLVEVRAINQQNQKTIGAVLVFHKPENIVARSYIIEAAEIKGFDTLITENLAVKDVLNRARHMCHSNTPLVIYGESGTGKKTISQAIHHTGTRKNNLFSSIDCSTLKAQQFQSELYGLAHPVNGKAGLFEITDGGTLYLQSVQEMSEACQKRLLEFIQTKQFNRVNGSIEKNVDVHIIASSPLPLKTYVENGQFNQDLFYTLDISQLNIPALRDRKEDIEPLVNFFLQQFASQGHKAVSGLSFDALNKVKSYYWPGNISQLKNILFAACMVSKGGTIEAENIEIDGHVHIESSLENRSLPQAVAEFEKHFLQHWYQKYTSTRKLAAYLGVSHTTIAQKLNKYGIN